MGMTEAQEQAKLSRRVALACGWTTRPTCWDMSQPHRYEPKPEHWHAPDGMCWENYDRATDVPPRFATSLDACFGPGGPVEYAQRQGTHFLSLFYECLRMEAHKHVNILPVWWFIGLFPEDYCRAFLAAVEASKKS